MATLHTDSRDAAPEEVPPERDGASRAVKRVLDRVLAGFGLLVTAPVLAGIALVLWWRSRPVLRRDERIDDPHVEHQRRVMGWGQAPVLSPPRR